MFILTIQCKDASKSYIVGLNTFILFVKNNLSWSLTFYFFHATIMQVVQNLETFFVCFTSERGKEQSVYHILTVTPLVSRIIAHVNIPSTWE